MICPVCGAGSKLINSKAIYGRSYGNVWVCNNHPACDTYVGCHGNTGRALGHMADARTRRLRQMAHRCFDPLWRNKERFKSRDKAYKWMERVMGKGHISELDGDECLKLLEEIGEL